MATDDVCPVFGETYLTPLHVDDAVSLAPDQARAFAHQLGEAARYADEGEQGGQR